MWRGHHESRVTSFPVGLRAKSQLTGMTPKADPGSRMSKSRAPTPSERATYYSAKFFSKNFMEMKIIGPSRVGIAFAWSGTVRQHQHDRSQLFRALAMPAYRYVEENSSAAMLPAQRSVHRQRCLTRGESHVTRSSKQGYQWPHKRDLCPKTKMHFRRKQYRPLQLSSRRGGLSAEGECLPGGGVSAQGGVCPGGCLYPSMQWGRHPLCITILDTRLWKHYQ